MEDQNIEDNDEDLGLLFGDQGGRTPADYLTQVNKLSHAFEMVCLGGEENDGEGFLRLPHITATVNDLKRSIGLANNEYVYIDQIETGFNSLLQHRMLPDHIKIKTFREDFSGLTKFYERFNLSPEQVFGNFGRSLKASATTLGVDGRILKSYIKDEFKIKKWPVGQSGGKLLVQLRTGDNEYAYAFDMNLTDGVEVLNTKVLTWVGRNDDANVAISYYAQGVNIAVDNNESWNACKMFFANFDRIYLTLTGH